MRKNNIAEMTIVEQIAKIKEDTCIYACKYNSFNPDSEKDVFEQRIELIDHCKECPLQRLHFTKIQ